MPWGSALLIGRGHAVSSMEAEVSAFTSNMLWYPELKLGVVVLTNTEQNNLRDQIVDEVLAASSPPTSHFTTHAPARSPPFYLPMVSSIMDQLH